MICTWSGAGRTSRVDGSEVGRPEDGLVSLSRHGTKSGDWESCSNEWTWIPRLSVKDPRQLSVSWDDLVGHSPRATKGKLDVLKCG